MNNPFGSLKPRPLEEPIIIPDLLGGADSTWGAQAPRGPRPLQLQGIGSFILWQLALAAWDAAQFHDSMNVLCSSVSENDPISTIIDICLDLEAVIIIWNSDFVSQYLEVLGIDIYDLLWWLTWYYSGSSSFHSLTLGPSLKWRDGGNPWFDSEEEPWCFLGKPWCLIPNIEFPVIFPILKFWEQDWH